MKEFSVEIKAKFYDEAIKRAKELAIDGYLDAVAVNEIFSELEESDDERIRKRIIHALLGDVLDIEETNEAIDWLKRQGEQKHQYISRPKYIGEKDLLGEQKPAEWAKEDIQMYRNILFYLSEPSPLKEVNGKSREQLLDWFKALKDRAQLKQERSEKDKKLWVHDDDIFLDAAKMIVEDSPRKSYGGVHKKEIVPWFYSLKERLKSLRPQNE